MTAPMTTAERDAELLNELAAHNRQQGLDIYVVCYNQLMHAAIVRSAARASRWGDVELVALALKRLLNTDSKSSQCIHVADLKRLVLATDGVLADLDVTT